MQKEKQEADATESLTQRNVDLANDTHTALARTVKEKRITSQDTNTGVSLASRSSVPAYPIGPRRSFSALAAALGNILLWILIILLKTCWNSNEVSPPAVELNSASNVENKSMQFYSRMSNLQL